MTIPDQTELLATVEQLRGQVAALTTEREAALAKSRSAEGAAVEAKTLNEAHGREIASLNRQLANARADVTQLTAERDAAVAAKAAAEAQLTDFNARVAAEVKRLGLSRTPAGPDPAGSAGRKLTATEQVLAAKGVKTLAELGASAA